MKKMSKFFKGIFKGIYSFFDKWLITPITKLILRISELGKSNSKGLEKLLKKKSTLLVISLLLAFGTFYIIDNNSNVMIDQYAEVLYKQKVVPTYNEELYVVEGLPSTVDITLIGQKRHIFLAKQTPTSGVTVDLTGLKPGNHKVKLKYTQQLKSIDYRLDPSTVTVTIYEKVSQTKSLTYDILHRDNLDTKLYIKDVELSRSDIIIKGAEYKLEKVATVKALIDGTADMVATDHAPHSEVEKQREYSKCPNGIIGIETSFPIIYTKFVKTGLISLDRFLDVMVYNPIKVFKLPVRKLEKGYVADLCVLDIDNPHVYTKEEILSKSTNSPFLGNEYYGFNILTICNGKIVYKK